MADDLPDLPDIDDVMHITDPSQFEALSSGLRMRILQICQEPTSVRGIAERLGMPVTRLYYHVNLLADAGFIEVVHTRKSGARLEKLYRVKGKTIAPGPELMQNVDDPGAAARAATAIIVEPARAETEEALRKRFAGDEQRIHLGRSLAMLTPEQIDMIEQRLADIIDELRSDHDPDDPDARGYAFTYTLMPSDVV